MFTKRFMVLLAAIFGFIFLNIAHAQQTNMIFHVQDLRPEYTLRLCKESTDCGNKIHLRNKELRKQEIVSCII